jgi:uncharacterized protein (TIGR03435 family)
MSVTPSSSAGASFTQIALQSSGFQATNITAKDLIAYAYGVKTYSLVDAPQWITTARFDVQATEPQPEMGLRSPGELQEHRRAVVQSILDRAFHLKFHKVSKSVVGYALITSNSGPRVTQHDSLTYAASRITNNKGRIDMTALPLGSLADELSEILGVRVVDQTSLTGNYDLSLSWNKRRTDENPALLTETLSSALLDQLGLTLVTQEVNEESFVFDNIKVPRGVDRLS